MTMSCPRLKGSVLVGHPHLLTPTTRQGLLVENVSEVSDEDKAMATTFWHLNIVELGWHNYTLRIQRW